MSKKESIKEPLEHNVFSNVWRFIESIFEDMADFASTRIGLFLTMAIISAGVVAFIGLTFQGLPFIAAFTFLGCVFGAFGVDLVGSQIRKCGFFNFGDKGRYSSFHSDESVDGRYSSDFEEEEEEEHRLT